MRAGCDAEYSPPRLLRFPLLVSSRGADPAPLSSFARLPPLLIVSSSRRLFSPGRFAAAVRRPAGADPPAVVAVQLRADLIKILYFRLLLLCILCKYTIYCGLMLLITIYIVSVHLL